jgi:lipocalin
MTSITADYAPVDKLDLTKYVGRWYQVYKNRFDNTFQGGGTCAVADYQLVDTAVTVSNNQINKDGSLGQIKGSAFYSPGNTGGELTVSLDGVPREAPYWVIEIGPVKDNQYEYSIVSDNNRFSLFVLARNVTQYYEEYDERYRYRYRYLLRLIQARSIHLTLSTQQSQSLSLASESSES